MDISALPTIDEAKAHALANYEATNGLVTGGGYTVRLFDDAIAECDLRVIDGAVRLVSGQVIAW